MRSLKEPIEGVLGYPDGERWAFDLCVEICQATYAPIEENGEWSRQRQPDVSNLVIDDLAVKTTLRLWQKQSQSIPEALQVASRIAYSQANLPPYYAGLTERFLQLLRELSVYQTARIASRRALAHIFPPEVVEMVGDNMIERYGISRDLYKQWSTERPRDCNGWRCEGSWCEERTSEFTTQVAWCANDHQWIRTHLTERLDRVMRCPLPLDQECSSHHYRELEEGSGVPIDGQPSPWSMYERWGAQFATELVRRDAADRTAWTKLRDERKSNLELSSAWRLMQLEKQRRTA